MTIEALSASGSMTTSNPNPVVPMSSLKLGELLGSGGQGRVFRVANRPGTVLKDYYYTNANGQSLQALVDFPYSLDPRDRDLLFSQTAWPRACVTENGATRGFLMDEVPAPFFGRVQNGKMKLHELQYLLYPHNTMWGEIRPLDATGRLQLARDLIALVRLLHEHSIVFGDISMRNILWRPGNPTGIFLLDCDSAGRLGLPPVLRQPQTVDWDDPHMPSTGPDLDTDRYKVALAIGRMLAGSHAVRPGDPWMPMSGIPVKVADKVRDCFTDAAMPHNSRPALTRWEQVLSEREVIEVKPIMPPVLGPAPPMLGLAPIDSSSAQRPRESIPVQSMPSTQPVIAQLPAAPMDGPRQREVTPLTSPVAQPPSIPQQVSQRKERETIPLKPLTPQSVSIPQQVSQQQGLAPIDQPTQRGSIPLKPASIRRRRGKQQRGTSTDQSDKGLGA